MIKFLENNTDVPYGLFRKYYRKAIKAKQKNIEAICISSYDSDISEVDARYVNLKFVSNKSFIFFTNYNSPKANQFKLHNQITGVFYWDKINTQIRIKARIKKTSLKFNENYFKKRSKEKNALAISSNQSNIISSYEKVNNKFINTKKTMDLSLCPEYWGGYAFEPYYFEFWEGNISRVNKRRSFLYKNKIWKESFLEP